MEASPARNVEAVNGDAGAAVAMDRTQGDLRDRELPRSTASGSCPTPPGSTACARHRGRAAHRATLPEPPSLNGPRVDVQDRALTAALEEVSSSTTYGALPGHMELGTAVCWQKHGHGAVGVTRSLTESCNIFYYNVGIRLGQSGS